MARDTSMVLSSATLQTAFAEAYRALRTNLSSSGLAHGARALLVTSGAPGEGKSTTVANLGILMAQAGQRVILVDADFRRPSLHRLLAASRNGHRVTSVDEFWGRDGVEPVRQGLAELIAGKASFVEVATPVEGVENLVMVTTGVIPTNPAELLASPRMRGVLVDLCDHADVVLLDSPPSSLYSDAQELTQVTDGFLYVLRSGPQRLVNHGRVLKQLQQGQARLIGIVMNQVEARAAGYEGSYRGGAPARG